MSDSGKITLEGFNNLTKSLSFNIYDLCYAATPAQQREYIDYIDEAYNADRLTHILSDVAEIIGATILNIARQDYDPQGASVTMLVADEGETPPGITNSETPGPLPDAVVAHLDKSHLTVHTYPEIHPHEGISSFRADIDVSTCGTVSPLKALNYLIHSFESDIVLVDYRVRGFTRDTTGRKHYIDHDIHSIQYFLSDDTLDRYHCMDVNVQQERMYHTKMMLRTLDLDAYLFGIKAAELSRTDHDEILGRVRREMEEIFYGR
ncbi:MAG: adenosylmethionine decarboxylase [Chromatiales bacterium]|nr:adenosylmethionine decarboxylase [Chromatiales bacterium]